MEKVKLALTIFSIIIIAGPLLGAVLVYRNNLGALVFPPQLQNLSNSLVSDALQPSQSLPQFQLPQPVGQPQYNPETGAFNYPFNFTNPLTIPISLDQLSAQVVTENNVTLGNVSIDQPITVAPGADALLNVTGTLSQDAVNQVAAQYASGNLNVALENVNANIGGIIVHIDQIDAGSIPA